MLRAYVLHHERDNSGVEDVKLIGVFESQELAQAAVEQLKKEKGFRDYPNGFSITEYEVNRIWWKDGFVIV